MMDEDFVERRPADLEIYRRLDAFATARLAPDAAAMARIRTALMGQALAAADARSAALMGQAPLAVALPERPVVAFPRPKRRAAAAILAACLVVGVGATSVAASQAGGPLYGPRMWIEAATLPTDAVARADAQFARLDARLQEVRLAVRSGNADAAEAALKAYAVIVSDLDAGAATNLEVAASLEDDLARRQLVLVGLLDKVPAQAQDAIQHALQQGAKTIDKSGNDPHPGAPARPGAGGQGGQGQGGGSQGQGGQGQGGQGQGGGSQGQSQDGGSQGQGPGTGQGADAGQGGDAGQGAGEGNGPASEPTPDRTPKPTKPPKEPAGEATPEQQPAATTDPAGGAGNENKNGGSNRQNKPGVGEGAEGGPGNDQSDD